MLIRHLEVSNFRGIRHLDWHIDGRVICLLGPGDSTKTTILDSIEFALAPRWYLPFSDCDFHNGNTNEPIRIQATVGDLTDDLVCDDRCGLYLRGYSVEKGIQDEPEDGYEAVITLRLEVGEDLEPKWELIKAGLPDPKPLSWRDRERLCMSRLGEDVFRHLTWSRGSALARITDRTTATGPILALANRAAGGAIAGTPHPDLLTASAKAKDAASTFGVRLPELRPGLDAQNLNVSAGTLSLHDEVGVPVRQMGLGSSRLTGLAIQHVGLGPESILLIDEVEYGLEPHRIRRLLKKVEEGRRDGNDGKSESQGKGQVIMTTHSPTPIMALNVADLRFVRTQTGETKIERARDATDRMQRIARKLAHAFLAEKILVCEGKTEEALCWALEELWVESGHPSFAFAGVVAVDGGGNSDGPEIALELRRLGYDVCFFGDSDKPLSVQPAELTKQGVAAFTWAGEVATEERIALDLPLKDLQVLLEAAFGIKGKDAVLSGVATALSKSLNGQGETISEWLANGIDEVSIRTAIGKASKSKNGSWFKNLNDGQILCAVVVAALSSIPASDLAKLLAKLEAWVHGK